MRRVLVTGAAGFIGFHTARALLRRGDRVVGVDDLNDYYDPDLKQARLERLRREAGADPVAAASSPGGAAPAPDGGDPTGGTMPAPDDDAGDATDGGDAPGAFRFQKLDLADRAGTAALFRDGGFDAVVHMAAQAGVRYSLEAPHAYVDANVAGLLNVLEGCRNSGVGHLVFASSSSVYGANAAIPYSVHDPVDHPVSLYAATKRGGELMAHAYAHLYELPVTCLRFFTVYGPWGRPDMAYFLFTRAMLEGETIQVFNQGRMRRGFTYVDDVVDVVAEAVGRPARPDPGWSPRQPDPASSGAPFQVYNVGHPESISLMEFIETLERVVGREAEKEMLPMQPGDVKATDADVADLARDFGFAPSTPLEDGLRRFVAWYREFYET